jgi:hypothetical protein
MLTRLIVASYAWLVEAALWFALVLAVVVGYHFTVPLMDYAGAVPINEFAWKVFGATVFAVITFLVLAAITGPLLVLTDVRQAVRSIEAGLERGAAVRRSHPVERSEPSMYPRFK